MISSRKKRMKDIKYEKVPEEFKGEVSRLYELGLESYEIKFLMSKRKNRD